ncbi:MAG: hypothetical protein O7G87_19265, partial [bacterium]|nr:hypothetical protein [bacterium]
MESVRVGIFGLTHPHTWAHLRTLQHSDWVSEVVLYDPDSDVCDQAGKDQHRKVVCVYADLEEALEK